MHVLMTNLIVFATGREGLVSIELLAFEMGYSNLCSHICKIISSVIVRSALTFLAR